MHRAALINDLSRARRDIFGWKHDRSVIEVASPRIVIGEHADALLRCVAATAGWFHWDGEMRGTSRWRKIIACSFLAGLLLEGCTYYPFGQREEQQSAEPTPAAKLIHARAVRSTPPQVAAKAHVARPSATYGTIARVVGLNEQQVKAKFGAPSVREERRPGRAWIYHEADCRLEVSFYPDVQTHAYKALGYEVTSNAGTNDGNHRCATRFASRISTN